MAKRVLQIDDETEKAIEHIKKHKMGYKEVADRFNHEHLDAMSRSIGVHVIQDGQNKKVKRLVDAIYRSEPVFSFDEVDDIDLVIVTE